MDHDISDSKPIGVLAAMLPEDYRDNLVRRTLSAIRRSKTASAQRVKRALGDHVKISGFRDASRALMSRFDLLCQETSRGMIVEPALTAAILMAWSDLDQDLHMVVEESLKHADVQCRPLGDMLPLERGAGPVCIVLDALAEEFTQFDLEDLRLMVACLSGYIPVSPDPPVMTAENSAPQRAATGMIWDAWLPTLDALPADAHEWDEPQLAGFIQTLNDLALCKREERSAGRARLLALVESLRSQHLERLLFVVLESDVAAWDAESIALNRVDALANDLAALIDHLQSHEQLEQRPIHNAPERRQREAEMHELEDAINARHDALVVAFAAASVAPAAPDELPPTSHEPDPAQDSAPADASADHSSSVPPAEELSPETSEAADSPDQDTPPEILEPEAGPIAPEPVVVDADSPSLDSQDVQEDLEPFDLGVSTSSVVWPIVEAPAVVAVQPEEVGEPASAQPPMPSNDSPIAKLAGQLRGGEPHDRPGAFATIIWELMQQARYDLAYQLTRHLEHVADIVPMPSALLRALILAPAVSYDVGEIASLLKQDYTVLPVQPGHADMQPGYALMVMAATLRPALLAPSTGAPIVLKNIPHLSGLPTFHRYCQVVADYGQHQQPLDMIALRFVNDRAAWQHEISALCQQVNEWRSQAKSKTIRSAQASAVWRRWQKGDGPIDSLLAPVCKNSREQAADVRATIEQLSDQTRFRQLVQHTDRIELGRRKGEDILGPALTQLQMHTEQAIDYARQWVRLQECRPDGRGNFFQAQAEHLRHETSKIYEQVINELDAYAQQHAPLSVDLALALACCRRTLDQIDALFDEYKATPLDEMQPRYLLNAALLRSAEIRCDDQWEPLNSSDELEQALLDLAACPDTDWQHVLATWYERCDHQQTGRVIEAARALQLNLQTVAKLEAQREHQIAHCRAELQREIEETRRHVENAVAYGLLREEERNAFLARILPIEIARQELLQFEPAHDELRHIRDEIVLVRDKEIVNVRQRLSHVAITPDHADYARIDAVLEAGDALAAGEYIDMILAKQPLPEQAAQQDVFAEFYPTAAHDIMQVLEEESAPQLIERLVRELRETARGRRRTRIQIPPFDRCDIPGPQADEGANLLECWFVVKKARRLSQTSATPIINSLGFTTLELIAQEPGRILSYSLSTRPIQNKNLCPVWQYGSGARGSYRLLCAWDGPTEHELVSALEEQAHDAPAIVFYFGRMAETRRQELARLCRERRLTCLLIDDLLLMYLCTLPAPRLPDLVDCALPFAHLDPYTTTAGIVPPEIFYGRQRERKQILDPMGSCFIYGGRQLGKTALLRDIEREMHDPAAGRLVLWIDLKAEGIGNQHPIDMLWAVIARALHKYGVLPEKGLNQISADRLLHAIQQWLEADQKRRILLLLDEADRFLANDGQSEPINQESRRDAFYRTSQIKGLMDRTDRRFKVVFAGLHNVKRTTRQSNHPLAHYGDPICIGPLLEDGEWRAARALIERPLSSLGFRFDSPDLVTRILSQTNYYPSLIQLYCKQLIKHLTDPHAVIEGPPYTITARHIEEVYQNQSLRDDIRQRFNLTIQLDQRYEVIAYVVAHGSLSGDGRGMIDGFLVDWIRQQALTWWAAGFSESDTEDQFLALLDEMVGLGILRTVRHGYYTLRSPNVVLLMGTLEQIEAELLRDREPPIEYMCDTFRAAYRDDRKPNGLDFTRRSPLTALQESALVAPSNGVAIICGSTAAGRDEIEAFLGAAAGQAHVKTLWSLDDRAAFGRELDTIFKDRLSSKDRLDSGTTVVLVSPACPWSESWIDDALEHLRGLRSRTSWVRVAFIAEPMTVWRMLNQVTTATSEQLHPEAMTLTLGTWHDAALRQWLDDCGFNPIDQHGRRRIREVTGNWPKLLGAFHELTRANTRYWQEALQSIIDQQLQAEHQAELFKLFELSHSQPLDVLRSIVQWGNGQPLSVEDIIADLGHAAADRVRLGLRWANLLNFALPTGKDMWRVDPLVQAALAAPRS